MTELLAWLPRWMYALLRFLPLLTVPAFTPFTWVPLQVRVFLLIAFATLGASVMPSAPATSVTAAALTELLIGACFALAVMLPMAAIGLPARLLDAQAGLSSASLFNPSLAQNDSLIGTALSLAATFVFFAGGFHVAVLRALVASARWVPLGSTFAAPDAGAFLAMFGSQFLLGLLVTMPAVLGLFAVDVLVAYASRSMPQANIYFLALPVKVIAALVLLAWSLKLAPGLIGRVFADALERVPSVLQGARP